MKKGLANSITEEMLQQHLRSKLRGMGDDITLITNLITQISISREAGEAVTIQGGHISEDGLLYNAVNPTKPINIMIAEEGDDGDIVKCQQLGDLRIPDAGFSVGATVFFGQSNLPINLTTDLQTFNPGEAVQPVGVAINSETVQINIQEPEYYE